MQTRALLDSVAVTRQTQPQSLLPSSTIWVLLWMLLLVFKALLFLLMITLPPLWLPYEDLSPHQTLRCHLLDCMQTLPTHLYLKPSAEITLWRALVLGSLICPFKQTVKETQLVGYNLQHTWFVLMSRSSSKTKLVPNIAYEVIWMPKVSKYRSIILTAQNCEHRFSWYWHA